MVKKVLTYNIAKISKYPRIRKMVNPKFKYMDTDGNKFTTVEAAKRYYKTRPEYTRRVNKPTIRVNVS